ncbi:MAG TPA: ThiF family adenylyltransferase [Planctomycetaceae bacterium]|nr:ThiF family adenylyltransferase [Planctomycetaceae bacterium]
MNTTLSPRFTRQADLIPEFTLNHTSISVIGVGAIGRQVALQLTAIGASQITLIDFDRVDETNLATQGYRWDDLGELKIEATAVAMRDLNPEIKIERIEDRFRASQKVGEAVFCCVDSITARQAIWRAAGRNCRFWCDGRMLGEVIRVLTATENEGREHYPTTLFASADAEPGRCTAKSTIYVANVAAGLMVHQFARWLRGQSTDADTLFNLFSGEVSITDPG